MAEPQQGAALAPHRGKKQRNEDHVFVLRRPANIVFSIWTCEFFCMNYIFTLDFSHQMGQSQRVRPSGWCVKALGHNKKRSYIKQKGFHVLIQQTLALSYVQGTENTRISETTLALEVLRQRLWRWKAQQFSMFWNRTVGNPS